jgi:hypothetical protein
VIRTGLKEFFDPFAVLCELILQNEEHFTKFKASSAFCLRRRIATAELGGFGKEFNFTWATFRAPKPAAVQELFSLTFACLLK